MPVIAQRERRYLGNQRSSAQLFLKTKETTNRQMCVGGACEHPCCLPSAVARPVSQRNDVPNVGNGLVEMDFCLRPGSLRSRRTRQKDIVGFRRLEGCDVVFLIKAQG
jgi:hypothetical protein